jgi:hypothetical protein
LDAVTNGTAASSATVTAIARYAFTRARRTGRSDE